MKTAIFLFECTGQGAIPWAKNGYNCLCLDIKNRGMISTRYPGPISFLTWDARTTDPADMLFGGEDVQFVAAHPPCTDLAVSGARWFAGKGLRSLAESILMFAIASEFCEEMGCPYYIENPRSTISTYWREPDEKMHPAQYDGYTDADDYYTKETWLWTGGGFTMPPPRMDSSRWLELPDNRIHAAPDSNGRSEFRSATPRGWAQAVFNYNYSPE